MAPSTSALERTADSTIAVPIALQFSGDGEGVTIIDGGSAVRLFDSTANVLTVQDMTLQNGVADDGGAIRADHQVNAMTTTFSGNGATANGGAISAGSVISTGSTFRNNSPPRTGARSRRPQTPTSSIARSLATVRPRVVPSTCTASPTEPASLFSANRADWSGALDALTIEDTNSTYVDNHAAHDGGAARAGNATILNDTFVGNTADGGGSISLGYVRLTNSIVVNDEGPACSGQATDDGGGNLTTDESCGLPVGESDINTADLHMGALADNGGPTRTVALRPGSLAIDAGVDPCPDEDQRSVPRQNGTPCDSGAFESDAGPDTVAPVVMTAADTSVDATDANGAIATYDPATAVDDRDGPLPADCSPASGSQFAIGVTQVTCTATDSAGNTGFGWFWVTVTSTAVTYPLIVTKDGSGQGKVSDRFGPIDCGAVCSGNYEQGSSVHLMAVADPGSIFTGWGGDSGDCALFNGQTCVIDMNGAKSVTATFALITPVDPLNVTTDGTGTGTVDGTGIACGTVCSADYPDGTQLTLTATAGIDSTFDGWGGDCADRVSEPTCTLTMDGPRTVSATFSLITYPLIVTKDGSGQGKVSDRFGPIDCGAVCSGNYEQGSSVHLMAVADPGSIFTGWGGDSGDCALFNGQTCVIAMNGAKSVTATFALITHPLQLSTAGSGTGTVGYTLAGNLHTCPSDCSADYPDGTQLLLFVTPASDAMFTGWSGDGCSGTAFTCTVTMDQARTITATFVKMFALTVHRAGEGFGTIDQIVPCDIQTHADCSAGVETGHQLHLSATAALGSTFTGWSGGGCSGTGTCSFTATADVTLTATFVPTIYPLQLSTAGSGTGTVGYTLAGNLHTCPSDCSADYPDGTQLLLFVTPASDAMFTGWSGDGCSGTAFTCTVTMDQARTITATFVKMFALTVHRAGEGFGTIDQIVPCDIQTHADCSAGVETGHQLHLSATAALGSTFTGWSGGGCSAPGPARSPPRQTSPSPRRSFPRTGCPLPHSASTRARRRREPPCCSPARTRPTTGPSRGTPGTSAMVPRATGPRFLTCSSTLAPTR